MSRGWYYKAGDWNIICDSCSKKIKASDSKMRWDGFIVCPSCFEQRHPQDFIRARMDKISVPYTRPPGIDRFIEDIEEGFVGICNESLNSCFADLAGADCAIVGNTTGYPDIFYNTYCTYQNSVGISGLSVSGCAIAGKT